MPLYPLSFSTLSRRHFNFAANSFEDAHEYFSGLIQFFDVAPFQFSVLHSISCSICNLSSRKSEPSLELQHPLSSSSLLGCIGAFHKHSPVLDWTCPSCGVTRENIESFQLDSYPSILLVVLKRFESINSRTTKVMSPIHWDDVLSLRNSHYRLISTISHHGSINSGHYTANVHSRGQWYQCNDAVITPIHPSNTSSDVYLLAFEKL